MYKRSTKRAQVEHAHGVNAIMEITSSLQYVDVADSESQLSRSVTFTVIQEVYKKDNN
jgi:hypothetical protein